MSKTGTKKKPVKKAKPRIPKMALIRKSNPDKMTKEEILKELESLERVKLAALEAKHAYITANRWEYFKPFLWQNLFFDLVRRKNIVVAPAPNKIGKCLTYETLISTPNGDILMGDLFRDGKPFKVNAWNGKEVVVAEAEPPFKKEGLHKCYSIKMSDGSIIEAADHHRILTDSGWKFVEDLFFSYFPFSQNLQESNLEPYPSTRASDVYRLSQRQSSCRGRYSGDSRQYGEQLLSGGDTFRVSPPLQDVVRRHILTLFDRGGRGYRYIGTLLQFCGLLSSRYDRLLNAALSFGSLCQSVCTFLLRPLFLFRTCPQLSTVAAFQPLPFDALEAQGGRGRLFPSYQSPKKVNPVYINTNNIVSISPIGVKEVYDFSVPEYGNYIAGGLVHHNTTGIAPLIWSWLVGYEAWSELKEGDEGAVKVGDKYFRESTLGIRPPVRIRLTGEDWNHHLGQTVVPELKKWFPVGKYGTKKNTNGIEYFWTVNENGSTLELMTHDQDIKLFESWMGHGWIPDEPPPKEIFEAMSRGLFGNKGKVVIPSTPLKEAWILDDLILTNRTDVGVLRDLTCLDNEIFYYDDSKVLDELGVAGRTTKHWKDADGAKKEFFDLILYKDDKGLAAEEFLRGQIADDVKDIDNLIMRLKFLKFAKDTDLLQKPSRFFGMFKRLVGLVIKNFDREKHIIPAPENGIPTDWIVTPMIDLHLSKPHALSFFACDKHNRHYCIDEYWINCSPEELADIIIRKKKSDSWNIENAYIDPLSKGDNFMKNRVRVRDSFTIISERLAEEGIYLQAAKKDKESGYRNIRNWLEGPNKIPILFFLDTLQSNGSNAHNGIIYEIQRLCFDDNGKVEKVNDDFMENLYEYTLTDTEYQEMERESFAFAGGGGYDSEGWLAV